MLLITIFVELCVVARRSRTQAGSPQAVSRWLCCAMALRRTAWSEHGMASVNQTQLHCVNQMGKTHSKPLVVRHGRGMAWARHATCESALRGLQSLVSCFVTSLGIILRQGFSKGVPRDFGCCSFAGKGELVNLK
jgi:hypothetical protein